MSNEKKSPPVPLNDFEATVIATIRSRQPGIVIQSLEEQRVIFSLLNCLQHGAQTRMGVRNLTVWSAVSRYRISTLQPWYKTPPGTAEDKIPKGEQRFGDINGDGENPMLAEALTLFLNDKIQTDEGPVSAPGVLVLADLDEILVGDPVMSRRALREALWDIQHRGLKKTIIICGKSFDVADELGASLTIMPFELPTIRDLYARFSNIMQGYADKPAFKHIKATKEQLKEFARAAAGLTEAEGVALLRLALAKYQAVDQKAIDLALKEKANIVRRGGSLEVVEPKHGISQVGGLENLKAFIQEITPTIMDPEAAKSYGAPPISGVIFAGISGAGKSYMVEAIAAEWNLPCLKLDLGSVFGSLVGESEGNFRKMTATAEAIAPCVVMLDEMEKSLGGDSQDGGTTSRVKGALLSWLNDKPDNVIVISTINDIGKFSKIPELLRAGRFDKIFFCDLPSGDARKEILDIHLKRVGHPMPANDVSKASLASQGYSGAELKVAVESATRAAFAMNPRPKHPSLDMLLDAIRMQVPLSRTMADEISQLRKWCQSGKAQPAGKTLEDDVKPEPAIVSESLVEI